MGKRSSRAFNRKVRSVLFRTAETKQVRLNGSTTGWNSGINSAADQVLILPSIAQGTQDYQRVGSKCQAIRLRFVLYAQLTWLSGSTTNTRCGVRVLIWSPKAIKSNTNIVNITSSLFRVGNGASGYFDGTPNSIFADVNNDYITTYYDKVHIVSQPYIRYDGGASSVNTALAADLSKSYFKVRLNKKLRRVLTFDSPGDSNPTNMVMYLSVGYGWLDGGTADTLSTNINGFWNSTLDFKDI